MIRKNFSKLIYKKTETNIHKSDCVSCSWEIWQANIKINRKLHKKRYKKDTKVQKGITDTR